MITEEHIVEIKAGCAGSTYPTGPDIGLSRVARIETNKRPIDKDERRRLNARIDELSEELYQIKCMEEIVDLARYPSDLKLPFQGMKLFLFLYENRGKIVSNHTLQTKFVDLDSENPRGSLRVRICKLRKFLNGSYEIITACGRGYFIR